MRSVQRGLDYAVAHCITTDIKINASISIIFIKQFKGVKDLHWKPPQLGFVSNQTGGDHRPKGQVDCYFFLTTGFNI